MIFYIITLMTIFNILILIINANNIRDFKLNQIDFINQQNRNTVAIWKIQDKLEIREQNDVLYKV